MPTADELIGPGVLTALRSCLTKVGVTPVALRKVRLEGLSYSERGRAIRDAMLADLPVDWPAFAAVVTAALPDPRFTGWMIQPVADAVAVRASGGTGKRDFEDGLALLAELTSRLTGEFALRTFLDADVARTLRTALRWTRSADVHVRRLASEGTRPYLPWGRTVKALLASPEATVPILDALRRDDSDYVRRSVANHLNDLSRFHPDLVVATAARWLADDDTRSRWVVKHALRTLVKKGNPDALALLGFPPADGVEVSLPELSVASVRVGEELTFRATLTNGGSEPATLAVDYLVHHVKSNGTTTAKVFKLKVLTLAAGESVTLAKRHSFKLITTRVYHPGTHALGLQVNGQALPVTSFELLL